METMTAPTVEVSKALDAPLWSNCEGSIGYDIETDNTEGLGLNPWLSKVTELSIVDHQITQVHSGNEVDLLEQFILLLERANRNNVDLIGWNNWGFDDPFLAVRIFINRGALRQREIELPDTLEEMLLPVPDLTAKYPVAGGFDHPQRFLWNGRARSADMSFKYAEHAAAVGVKHSLKPVCFSLGAKPIELDRANLHRYSQAERDAYSASDSLMALYLSQWSVLGLRNQVMTHALAV